MMISGLAAAHMLAGTSLLRLGTLAAWQADAIDGGNAKWLMIFVGLVALAMVTQAIVVIALAMFAMKAEKRLMEQIEEIKGKVLPLIAKSHGLVVDLTPQIKQITTHVQGITAHVEEIAGVARAKAHEFSPTISAANVTVREANETVRDANRKTHAQVERINGMISGVLDATTNFGRAIRHGVTQPGREVAGVTAGVKAALNTFFSRSGGGTVAERNSAWRSGRTPYRPEVSPYSTMAELKMREETTYGRETYGRDKTRL